jgi:putative intracellular protease/amidase
LSPNNNLRLFIPRRRAYGHLAIDSTEPVPAPRDRKETEMATVQGADQHHEIVDVTISKRPKVLMVVANPTTSTTTGWAIGFWAAELTHPYYEFNRVRYDVTIASPDGGKVELDALSDPRDESKWSADDLISMGFLNTPKLTALLEDTPRLADLDPGEFDALIVCGGNAPMFQFRQNEDLKRAIAAFYEAEKPTALLCHGVSALIDVQLSDGSYLVEGKTVTGFANVEEDYVDRAVGQKVMPYRIEDELRKRGANYVQSGLFRNFAVRDGRLITGQQQYSGPKVAELVIAALGI